MKISHTGNMPWDKIFDNMGKDYTPTKILSRTFKAVMIPVEVIKELWNGEITEEKKCLKKN